MEQFETWRLVIKALSDADAEMVLPVYLNSTDYLETQTPDEPSIEMVREDMRLAAQHNGSYCGIFRRDTKDLIGVISFAPGGFRGQRDYAWLSLLMIQVQARRRGFGREAYQAVEAYIFGDVEVKRIGALLLPQFEASLRFAEAMGFERVGGPFKNKRGYGLYSFAKKRPGLPETPGETIWREAQKVMLRSDE